MQYPSCLVSCAVFAIALGSTGCVPAAGEPNVTYGADPSTDATAGRAGAPPAGSGGSVVAGSGGAGRVAMAGSGGAGSAALGGSGGAGGSGSTTCLRSVSFDVTPLSQGGRYSPRNIGAIWVQSSSGAFVKSLEVWAAQRRRYLTRYNTAVGSSSTNIDVTATATQSSLKPHHVTWNLKDRTGAAVAPGAYSMLIEVTDHDGSGQSYAVDFNVHADAATITPPSAQYYGAMSLQLQ